MKSKITLDDIIPKTICGNDYDDFDPLEYTCDYMERKYAEDSRIAWFIDKLADIPQSWKNELSKSIDKSVSGIIKDWFVKHKLDADFDKE